MVIKCVAREKFELHSKHYLINLLLSTASWTVPVWRGLCSQDATSGFRTRKPRLPCKYFARNDPKISISHINSHFFSHPSPVSTSFKRLFTKPKLCFWDREKNVLFTVFFPLLFRLCCARNSSDAECCVFKCMAENFSRFWPLDARYPSKPLEVVPGPPKHWSAEMISTIQIFFIFSTAWTSAFLFSASCGRPQKDKFIPKPIIQGFSSSDTSAAWEWDDCDDVSSDCGAICGELSAHTIIQIQFRFGDDVKGKI